MEEVIIEMRKILLILELGYFCYLTSNSFVICIFYMADLHFPATLCFSFCGEAHHPFFFSKLIRFSPLPISAITGTGTEELLDLVCSGIEKIEVFAVQIVIFILGMYVL